MDSLASKKTGEFSSIVEIVIGAQQESKRKISFRSIVSCRINVGKAVLGTVPKQMINAVRKTFCRKLKEMRQLTRFDVASFTN